MTYKKKLITLSSLVAMLALVYTLSLIFDPARQGSRAFAWMDPRQQHLADRIEIFGPAGNSVLIRINDVWFLSESGIELPVRQQRVQDLFAALSRRDVYTLRSTSLEVRDNLGLSVWGASRIIVRGGIGLPLLDLLIGRPGALGREVYLARAYEREIYSGEDRFSFFTDWGPRVWLDFRLFPPTHAAAPAAAMVQQVELSFALNGAAPETYMLRRSGAGWVLQGNEGLDLANPRVDAWLRSVLEAEGEDFAAHAPSAAEGSITLWFGDGTVRTIHLGPVEDGENRRKALVSGSALVHVLSSWTVERIFMGYEHFIR